MSDLPHLQIIRESDFDQQLQALIRDPEEAEEYIAGAEYTLAKWPDAGMPASSTGKTWYLPMSPIAGKRVSIYYTFDETTVILLWIQAFED